VRNLTTDQSALSQGLVFAPHLPSLNANTSSALAHPGSPSADVSRESGAHATRNTCRIGDGERRFDPRGSGTDDRSSPRARCQAARRDNFGAPTGLRLASLAHPAHLPHRRRSALDERWRTSFLESTAMACFPWPAHRWTTRTYDAPCSSCRCYSSRLTSLVRQLATGSWLRAGKFVKARDFRQPGRPPFLGNRRLSILLPIYGTICLLLSDWERPNSALRIRATNADE
jgi:hypothetical protein